jgi:hypothetical protein
MGHRLDHLKFSPGSYLAGVLGIMGISLGLAYAVENPGWNAQLPSWLEPAIAHEVEISGEVGGMLHIEPNDRPRAGQSATAWFALTRRGGQLIPLSQCDCELSVYSQPYRSENSPILRPTLQAITAEGQQGIPAANFTFPRAGAYELVLRGRPRSDASFDPFELRFSVTVAR